VQGLGARWTSSPGSTTRSERPPDGLTVRSPLVFHREGDQSLYSEDQDKDEFSKSENDQQEDMEALWINSQITVWIP